MNHKDFNEFLESMLDKISNTLTTKAEQYSTGTDRFHNFKRAAIFDNKSSIEALRGMQTKHRVAIADFLDQTNITDTPYEQWEEKIVDNINYYLLMLGMIKDEFDAEEDVQNLAEIFPKGCNNCRNDIPSHLIRITTRHGYIQCIKCGRIIE